MARQIVTMAMMNRSVSNILHPPHGVPVFCHAPIKEILGGFSRMSTYARTNSATNRAADNASQRPTHQAKGNDPGDVARPIEVRPALVTRVLRRAIRDRYIARRSRA